MIRNSVSGLVAVTLLPLLLACGPQDEMERGRFSSPLVTDVQHTVSKRQSIGNCWLYATATWLESMELSHAHQTLNASESYWTWWHFYNQLVKRTKLEELDTGGSFDVARSIILQHGFVSEENFIPGERDLEMSMVQQRALAQVNDALAFGELKAPSARTPAKVRQILDEAFGTDMARTEALAEKADQTEVDVRSNGQVVLLRDALDRKSPQAWREFAFPLLEGKDQRTDASTETARRALWVRVFRALNDRKPVVISLMIDFNALDNRDGTFKGDLLREIGPGHQGGHLTVLDDYTVSDVPGLGALGRGDMSPEFKEKALAGHLNTLVAKNSWGVDRPERGIKDGVTLFDRSYLEGQFPWKLRDGDPESPVLWHTTLSSFILPPGY